MKSVLLVDNSDFTTRGVELHLESTGRFDVVAKVHTVKDACVELVGKNIDVVVAELDLPGVSGVDLVQYTASSFNAVCVVLTAETRRAYMRRVIEAGALGYVTKGEKKDELITAIDEACAGSRYFSPTVAQELALQKLCGSEDEGLTKNFTPREFETFRLIGMGMERSAIAERMTVAKKTVSVYKQRIKEKLGAESRFEVVQKAMDFTRPPLPALD